MLASDRNWNESVIVMITLTVGLQLALFPLLGLILPTHSAKVGCCTASCERFTLTPERFSSHKR